MDTGEQLRKTRGEQVKSKTEAPFGFLLVKGKRSKVGKSGIPQNKIKLKKIKLSLQPPNKGQPLKRLHFMTWAGEGALELKIM